MTIPWHLWIFALFLFLFPIFSQRPNRGQLEHSTWRLWHCDNSCARLTTRTIDQPCRKQTGLPGEQSSPMYEIDTSMNCQSPTSKVLYLQGPRNGADLIPTDPSKCSAALKKHWRRERGLLYNPGISQNVLSFPWWWAPINPNLIGTCWSSSQITDTIGTISLPLNVSMML